MIVPGIVRPLCALLAVLVAAPPGSAQAPQQAPPQAAKAPATQTLPSILKIMVLEGNHAFNSVPLGKPITPIIEVRDDNDFPVEGATIVFTLPDSGPGGVFLGNKNTLTTRSDARGQAAAPFIINGIAGKFSIQVAATAGNRKGEAAIDQTNTLLSTNGPPVKKPWYKKWQTWAIIGAAAGVGVGLGVGLTHGGGSSSSSSSGVTITTGGPVFGGPH